MSFKSRRRSTGEIIGGGTNSGRPRGESTLNTLHVKQIRVQQIRPLTQSCNHVVFTI